MVVEVVVPVVVRVGMFRRDRVDVKVDVVEEVKVEVKVDVNVVVMVDVNVDRLVLEDKALFVAVAPYCPPGLPASSLPCNCFRFL